MNKRAVPALAAALAVVLAAVLLPSQLSALTDRSLLGQVHSEEVDTAEVSYVYNLTMEQRLSLLNRFNETGDLSVVQNASPAENELQERQAIPLLERFLSTLQDRNILSPGSPLIDKQASFFRIIDPENPNLYLSLWFMHFTVYHDQKAYSGESSTVSVLMDAETGLFYFFYLYNYYPEADFSGLPLLFGDFAGLSLTETAQTEPDPEGQDVDGFITDGEGNLWDGLTAVSTQVVYETSDQEILPYTFFYNAYCVTFSCLEMQF